VRASTPVVDIGSYLPAWACAAVAHLDELATLRYKFLLQHHAGNTKYKKNRERK